MASPGFELFREWFYTIKTDSVVVGMGVRNIHVFPAVRDPAHYTLLRVALRISRVHLPLQVTVFIHKATGVFRDALRPH